MNNEEVDFSKAEEKDSNIDNDYTYRYFEKDEHFLYEYMTFRKDGAPRTRTHYTLFGGKNKKTEVSFVHPTRIDNLDDIPPECLVYIDDNTIGIRAITFQKDLDISQAMKCKWISDNRVNRELYIRRKLHNKIIEYIKGEDEKYYNKADIGDKDFPTYLNMKKIGGRLFVLDKQSQEVDISQMNILRLLKQIRHCIAHNNNYEYIVNYEKSNFPFSGRVFIIDNQAVVVSDNFYRNFSRINLDNLDRNGKTFTFIYTPPKDRLLQTEEDIRQYAEKCLRVKIFFAENAEFEKVSCLYEYFVKQYNQSMPIEQYLANNISKVLGLCQVTASKLEDSSLLIKKCLNNPLFTKELAIDKQEEYINFLIGHFYQENFTENKSLQRNGKSTEISIKERGLSTVIYTFLNTLDEYQDNETKTLLKKYADECYITLCVLLAYINLVYNSFDDDIDDKKTKIALAEKANIENKLKVDIFSDFSKVNIKGRFEDKQEKVQTLKQMKEIISFVRNNISHSSFKVKISKNGNPENNILIFSQDDDFKNKNSNITQYIYQITCKDFIKFITNDIFMSYHNNNKKIITNNFEDFIQQVSSKIE